MEQYRDRDGLLLLNEAIAASIKGSSESVTPEFLILKGNLVMALWPENAVDAESFYQDAHNGAREMGAPMMELQAAIGLSRLWQNQGRKEQARESLSTAYSKITEGFSTADMKEAKALLDMLSS